ncbi:MULTISPECIES: hypothetical protein [Achromobacter]|uniref:Uncharacterized protein n=1 Tax=Achromobacter mucicolens TaxID=1389922 RepID=A0ABM8LL39_9BURK|nr:MULTISPECIES: hypothetical protein [Achromobacter]AVG43870.1 hypothetical protein MC81_30630 [Achromobacter insolitus]CAB3845900.1 hypothetical protein LMG3410_01514 [Achromobacter aegrifaciens]CAB3914114.1 hypothetical protein LMG3415_05135 [Achromobacter mucicolens]
MSMAINTVWHFNQEDLVVQWVGGRVVAVKAVSPKSQTRRVQPSASNSTRHSLPSRKPAAASPEQRIAA